ncbi:exported hypothetical protein [Frankia sp. AiPs1]
MPCCPLARVRALRRTAARASPPVVQVRGARNNGLRQVRGVGVLAPGAAFRPGTGRLLPGAALLRCGTP